MSATGTILVMDDRATLKAPSSQSSFGQHVRTIRKQGGRTLADLAEATGLSVSALSKIENDQVSPTFSNLLRLAEGFGIHVADLVTISDEQRAPSARLTVTRAKEQTFTKATHYSFAGLCAGLLKKRMSPMITRVRPRAEGHAPEMVAHRGEEFLYVLTGTVEIHTEHYKPAVLDQGDSLYMDSTMPHCYVVPGDEEAELLVIWLPGGAQNEHQIHQEFAEVTGLNMSDFKN